MGSMLECLVGLLRRAISASSILRTCLDEVAVYGSLVRGDFDPRISDVDFFLVISDECTSQVAEVLYDFNEAAGGTINNCLSGSPARGVDVAWCLESEVDKGCDYKFLTIYRDDFDSNHVIIWGGPLHESAPRQPLQEALCISLKRVKRRIMEWGSDSKLLAIAAGEAIKLALISHGYDGPWSKHEVLSALRQRYWVILEEFWSDYIKGRHHERSKIEKVIEVALELIESAFENLGITCSEAKG